MKNRQEQRVAQAREAAVSGLWRNHRLGHSKEINLPYNFTCPSPGSYPFQWAWDSSYHAISLLQVDTQRARAEISSLLSAATPSGFLPHMVLWQDELRPRATAEFRIDLWQGWRVVTIAPPVIAKAIERVFEATGDSEWLAEVLPPTIAFFGWLAENRTSEATGLLEIYQPDESGLDISPKYDRALGIHESGTGQIAADWHQAMRNLIETYSPGRTPESRLAEHRAFVWNDVLVNTIYAHGLLALSRLALTAGLPQETASRFVARSQEITDALIRHCWDDEAGAFFDLDLVSGQRVEVLTASSLFPIILDSIPTYHAERLIEEHLLNEAEFWLPVPVPSVAATEPSFDPDFSTKAIFRGSSWLNLNWYLYWGLRARGYADAATTLAERTIDCVAEAGMRECYGPYRSVGYGAESFGWSSLVLDLINAEKFQ
ncbi:MGH1-like glycoside hydrolase domain-containing protein [Streptomyces sp. NPDC087294]|uniref:MGH1-like glycoside hydrolase domain-containing protein n=1 Tax=Streptomyces sp. NPDC087294 TaxID=3365777 RepID=UPI003817D35B